MGIRAIAALVGLAAALTGCSDPGRDWAAETFTVAVAAPAPAERANPIGCRPLASSIAAEADSQTPIEALRDGGSQALSAALIASEARKNHRLREAVAAYQACAALQPQKSPAAISRAGL